VSYPPTLIEDAEIRTYSVHPTDQITIEYRGTGSWCVALAGGLVMHSTGQWVYERSPSNRTPGFLHHTRYSTPQEALDALNRMLPALEGR